MTEPVRRRLTDRGFTLVELIIVLVLASVLTTVVVTTILNFQDDAQVNSCATDARTLETAAEAYLAQRGVRQLPAVGRSPDRHELALVAAGYLRSASSLYDLDADGVLALAASSQCDPE